MAELEMGRLIDDLAHPRRPNQRVLIVELNNYLCAVPYVLDQGQMFLKTIYPDRSLKEKYRSEP